MATPTSTSDPILTEAAALAADHNISLTEFTEAVNASLNEGGPKVSDVMDQALDYLSRVRRPSTVDSWGKYFKLVAKDDDLAAVRIGRVTKIDLEPFISRVRQAAQDSRGGTGNGAVEHFISAMRFAFSFAVERGCRTDNPAKTLRSKPRSTPARKALTSEQQEQFVDALAHDTNDPELCGLLYRFHRETAARLIEGLRLQIRHVNPMRREVELFGKGDTLRYQPISTRLANDLITFARRRGAVAPSDVVFRRPTGKPISKAAYEIISKTLRDKHEWARGRKIGVHSLRHTTGTQIERHFSEAIAKAFLGHAASSSGPNGTYVKVSPEDVAAVHRVMFDIESLSDDDQRILGVTVARAEVPDDDREIATVTDIATKR